MTDTDDQKDTALTDNCTPEADGNPRELTVTCHIAAAPDRVWQVMTQRMEEWWCPLPWRAEIIEQDWRAGGRCAMVMHGPDGERHGHDGIFLEVTQGVRFVSTDAAIIGPDGRMLPQGPFMIGGWEIAAEGDGTRYTAWARHWRDEDRASHEAMGFTDGWGACADQLKALCEA